MMNVTPPILFRITRTLEAAGVWSRGISGEVIQRAYEKWQESGGEQDEIAMMRKLLEKRRFDPDTASREERARTAQFLIRKGFPWEKVRRVLDFGGCEEC